MYDVVFTIGIRLKKIVHNVVLNYVYMSHVLSSFSSPSLSLTYVGKCQLKRLLEKLYAFLKEEEACCVAANISYLISTLVFDSSWPCLVCSRLAKVKVTVTLYANLFLINNSRKHGLFLLSIS